MRGGDALARSADTRRTRRLRLVLARDASEAGGAGAEEGANQVETAGIVLARAGQALVDFDLALEAAEARGTHTVVAAAWQACRL